jgi:hypothetical protein
MMEFPKTLYVRIEEARGDPYPIADETLDEVNETQPVAVYRLEHVGRAVVERKFVRKAYEA